MNNLNRLGNETLWSADLEAAVNDQIAVEMGNFMAYQAIGSAFAHATVGYPKIAAFFTKEADEEIKHARILIDYQNMRGGKVLFKPTALFQNDDIYTSLNPVIDGYRMALELEKHTYAKLLALHTLADGNDPQFADLLEEMLKEQLETQQSLNFNIVQLERANSGVAEYIHATTKSS
jgi:ferritin heavy chain